MKYWHPVDPGVVGPDSSFFGRIWSHQDGDIRSHSHQDGEIRSHSHQKAVVEQNRVYFTCKYIALNFFYFFSMFKSQ